MTPPAASASTSNLGFLTILSEPAGTLGGYLVTNAWGRPLEFRLTSAVQPNRVQTILYGPALAGFVCGELIGKTLVEKSTTPVRWIVTDSADALDLRSHVDAPVVLISSASPANLVPVGKNLYLSPRFVSDVDGVAELLALSPALDLSEPFLRIREAVSEAR